MTIYDNSNLAVPFDVDEYGEIHMHQDRDAIRDALAMQRGALITREEIDGLAKVDADFVVVSEQILAAALDMMHAEPNIAAMLEGKSRTQAIGSYITSKIIAREAKLEAQNNIAEVRIRYERELGKLIQKLQADGELELKGGTGSNQFKEKSQPRHLLTLKDVHITNSQSSRWQEMATLPDDRFEHHIAEAKENGWELTTASIFKHAQNTNSEHKLLAVTSVGYDFGDKGGEGKIIVTVSTEDYFTFKDLSNKPGFRCEVRATWDKEAEAPADGARSDAR